MPTIPDVYRDHVRVRVGALVTDPTGDRLLLVEHDGLWEDGTFWTPPGGGVSFGEGLRDALVREVQEETGVDVTIGPLRYVLDFVRPPLHAVSFYFEAHATLDALAVLALGSDPELADGQRLRSAHLVHLEELSGLTVYPEPFRTRLAADLRAGYPDATVYLGTFR